MQELENNQSILDPFGNTYEIYANLTMMTLLNLNQYWITQAELYLKGTFVKASFIFVTILLDMKILGEKIYELVLSQASKIINWIKIWHNFYFHASL